MTLHGRSLIAGSLGASTQQVFRAFSPAAGEAVAPDFYAASEAEANRAVDAAAASAGDLRSRSGEQRARFLEAIAAEIEKLGDSLLERCHLETALPLGRLQGERARTCAQLRMFAEVVREGSWVDARIDPALPDRQPQPRTDLRRMLVPIGPVVVFGSSNFPFAFSVAGGDTSAAFASGCPVVVKAHGAHPGTSELVGGAVARAVAACGLPPGIFSMVHGAGQTVGVAMVRHPAAAAVGFTGSSAAGRALFDVAASRPRPIPVFAEMSSLNPVFLLPEGVRERGPAIAQGLLGSFTLGVGQFCTKPGLVFAVRGPATDAFLASLADGVRAAPSGTLLTPGIRDAFESNRSKVEHLAGVKDLAASETAPSAAKTQVKPIVAITSAADFIRTPEMATEAFGPFTLVVVAEGVDEFSACAEAMEGQLTATVHGTPAELGAAGPFFSLLERKVGRIVVNAFPTGVEVCPAMQHGGPYPATSDSRFTSVGTAAMLRFARPVCYQGFPPGMLPAELQNENPLGLLRQVNGRPTRDALP